MRSLSFAAYKPLLAATIVALSASGALAQSFKFGVMSDTQWAPSEGHADKGVPTEIIDDVNQQFIKAGVQFVVQVGDITQNAGKLPNALDEINIRANHTKALTAAGIGFFPLRGNHEGTAACAVRFAEAFPGLPGTPGFKPVAPLGGGSSPALPGLAGCSYSFDYANATFVLLDQFEVADGSPQGKAYTIAQQQPWITQQLSAAHQAGRHTFVFGHKNLLGQHHKDNLFGRPTDEKDPGDNNPAAAAMSLDFIRSLQENGVRFYMSGHDHMYYRALVRSPETEHAFVVQQIITGSCSYKFYEPSPPYSANEQPIVQERSAVGYSIVSVDGPCVRVSYYSAPVETTAGNMRGEISQWKTPERWVLQDSFAYSLNGKQFLVKQGQSFAGISDTISGTGYTGTEMQILDGQNATVGQTLDDQMANRRMLANLVTTGWEAGTGGEVVSDVLSVWGMHDTLGAERGDAYVLAMSTAKLGAAQGQYVLLEQKPGGEWVEATSLNADGNAVYSTGKYQAGMATGTCGYDAERRQAWAVLDHGGKFAIGRRAEAHR